MPKSSHSSSRVPHRGPRHESDPDRRVKYVLRYRRKGDEVLPETQVVRRHRRSDDRDLAPEQVKLRHRITRRRRRREARETLGELTQEWNTDGQLSGAGPHT